MNNFPINKLNIAKIFYLLFIISLFFPIRYIFPTTESFQTGAYSDFTSISLYLSDIFLFLTVLFIFSPRDIKKWVIGSREWVVKALIVWLIIGLISHFYSLTSLNWWFFTKYLELIVAYETSLYLFTITDIKALFIKVFVTFTTIESILAIWQFKIQRSIGLGLHKVGESVISPKIQGIAKIVSGGTTYIRGYGTFPHPNLLSAFLVTEVFLTIYLLIRTSAQRSKILYSIALFINLLGLTVTFSRAAFSGLAIGLIVFFSYPLYNKAFFEMSKIWKAAFITLAGIIICIFSFHSLLSTRATVSDSASLERIFYAKIGLKMIAQHPIFGVGIGDSVLHMQQYAPFKLWPWQIQPIHNYFLLIAAELGIPGALILICFFLSQIMGIFSKIKAERPLYLYSLLSILLSFLVLMQFDHYFYTLQQTQMLLWVVLGIISGEIKIIVD